MRSIALRRLCLGLLVASLVIDAIYQHDFDHLVIWYVVLLVYGLMIAGAVQRVYRNVRVGRLETATMLATTVVFMLAILVAPRPVATIHHDVTRIIRVPDSLLPVGSTTEYATSTYNAPLLRLFGHRASTSTRPWLPSPTCWRSSRWRASAPNGCSSRAWVDTVAASSIR